MVGITAMLFWLLATGRILTKSQHESIVKLHEERYELTKSTLDTTIEQNSALIESAGAAREFFEKVPVVRRSPSNQQQRRQTGRGEAAK